VDTEAGALLTKTTPDAPPPVLEGARKDLRCSFCGRDIHDVRNLVEGKSGTHICNHCIAEFHAMMRKPEENPK
jgi:hypothetical protein